MKQGIGVDMLRCLWQFSYWTNQLTDLRSASSSSGVRSERMRTRQPHHAHGHPALNSLPIHTPNPPFPLLRSFAPQFPTPTAPQPFYTYFSSCTESREDFPLFYNTYCVSCHLAKCLSPWPLTHNFDRVAGAFLKIEKLHDLSSIMSKQPGQTEDNIIRGIFNITNWI